MPLFCFCCLPADALWIVLFSSGFLVLFFTSPFGIPYCQAGTPLEERYHGALVIFNQNKSPGSYPAQMKGKLKPSPSGWEENNRPALAAGDYVHLPQIYVSQRYKRKQY